MQHLAGHPPVASSNHRRGGPPHTGSRDSKHIHRRRAPYSVRRGAGVPGTVHTVMSHVQSADCMTCTSLGSVSGCRTSESSFLRSCERRGVRCPYAGCSIHSHGRLHMVRRATSHSQMGTDANSSLHRVHVYRILDTSARFPQAGHCHTLRSWDLCKLAG